VCIGPYSQANTLTEHLLLLAGQIGLVPETMSMAAGGADVEAVQALRNCAAVLGALGGSLRTAVFVVVYVDVGALPGETGGSFAPRPLGCVLLSMRVLIMKARRRLWCVDALW
jgi:hypothetical protein